MDWSTVFTPLNIAALILVIVALFVGSFLNILIYRIPIKMLHRWNAECQHFTKNYKDPDPNVKRILSLKSHCAHCGNAFSRWRFLPIVGYFIVGGKCDGCGTVLPLRSVIVELLTVLLSLIILFHFGLTIRGLGALIYTWLLIALMFIDRDTQLLPDSLVYLLLWIGLVFNLINTFTVLHAAVIGVVIGYLILFVPSKMYAFLRGHDAIGQGDYKFFAAICAWLGYQSIIPLLIIAVPLNFIVYIVKMLHPEYRHTQAVAFGPSLAVAAWFVLLFGAQITKWLMSLT